jgi:hypothetical protein
MLKSIGWTRSAYLRPWRPLASAIAGMILLAIGGTPALATVNDAYRAGTVVQRGNVNTGGPTTPINTAFGGGSDVAVDPANSKIYWAENLSGTAHIWVGNLNGSGGKTLLVTAPGRI